MKFILFFIILVTIPSFSMAQRVQLSGIPGQDSDMDIPDMLNQIMAPYRDEITNLNNKRLDKEIEFELWKEFKTNVDNFDRVNRYFLGYESPFKALTNQVSDPDALQVELSRNAQQGDYKITINNLASAHSLASAPISIDKVISMGDFSIIIEEKTNSIEFVGGNITDLYTLLRTRLSNDIEVNLLNASQTEKIIVLVTKKEGKASQLNFDGNIDPLLDVKLLTTGEQTSTNFLWQEDQTNTIISNSFAQINSFYPIVQKTQLSFSVLLTDIPQQPLDTNSTKISLKELSQNEIGAITNVAFILPGATPILEDIDTQGEIISNKEPVQQLILNFDDGTQKIVPLDNNKFSISLDEYISKTLESVSAIAENKILDISAITINSTPDGALKPYKETVQAQDASFLLNGVEIIRPSNIITDLIPGVSLELLQDHKTNIRVKITPDLELVKETIIQWVINYNQIMEEIFAFTTVPLDRIGRLKPLHQRLEDEEDLKEGTFYGNSTLINFKDRLRRIVGSSYGFDPNSLSLLDSIGIYVRRRTSFNSDPDALRKGTLTLDVGELEQKLQEDFNAVNQLFTVDTDNNTGNIGLIPSTISTLQMMTGGNGYLTKIEQDNSRKMKDIDTQLTKKEEEIDKVARKERQSLLQMSQAITQSKALSESLQQRFRY